MATPKQRLAIEYAVENGGNMSRAMMKAGYSPATAKTPQKLTETKGFREALAEYGLTEKLVVEALAEDIKKKPQRRVPELSLAADVLGIRKSNEEKASTTTNILILAGDQRARVARRIISDSDPGSESHSGLLDSDEPEI